MKAHTFHLSLEVSKYLESQDFYTNLLGSRLELHNDDWCNINLYGHQITLHNNPDAELNNLGNFHWGINLDHKEFEKVYDVLTKAGLNSSRTLKNNM